MNTFETFSKTWGEPQNKVEVPDKIVAKFTGKLPNHLLEFWNIYGLSSFGNSFLWTINPDEYGEVINGWLDISDYNPVVFMRNSFGGLFFWDKKLEIVQFLNIVRGEVRVIISDIPLLINRYLSDEKFLNNDLLFEYHIYAYDKLGSINEDECYAFEPAIALGGNMDTKNIKIRKMKPHLDILSQITEVVDLD